MQSELKLDPPAPFLVFAHRGPVHVPTHPPCAQGFPTHTPTHQACALPCAQGCPVHHPVQCPVHVFPSQVSAMFSHVLNADMRQWLIEAEACTATFRCDIILPQKEVQRLCFFLFERLLLSMHHKTVGFGCVP